MPVLIPNCLTDLNHIEDQLSLSSTYPATDLDVFESLINSSSRYIMQLTKRDFKYKTVSNEHHDGRGVQWLQTVYYPLISITSLYDDTNRSFGSSTLIASTDYEINNSNAGIVRRFDGVFTSGESNVRISYVSGFSEFQVVNGGNDQIVFNDGTARTATLDEGAYNAATLATEIQAKMDGESSDTITCTFSEISQKFTLASDGSAFELSWSTRSNTRATELGKMIGFNVSADDTGGTTYTADYPSLGIPDDLIEACNSLVRWRYTEIRENRTGKFSESRGEQSFSFDYNNVPSYINDMLQMYKTYRTI